MQLKNLSKVAYKTFIARYPSYSNFFHDVIKKNEPLYNSWLYTYSPVEDIESRKKLEKRFAGHLNRNYIQRLLIRNEGGDTPLEPLQQLGKDLHLVRYSDEWMIREGEALRRHGIETIEQIRKNLEKHLWRIEKREYSANGERIEETTLFEWYPFFLFKTREIFEQQKEKTKRVESELAFPEWNSPQFEKLKSFWEKYSITEILQVFRDINEIVGIVWNIKPDIEYSIIISHEKKKIEFPVNLLHRKRYYNLIKKAIKKNRLENVEYLPPEGAGNMGFGIYEDLSRALNFSDAVMGILDLALAYREDEHDNFPGYLHDRLNSCLNDIRKGKNFTTTALHKQRIEEEAYQYREYKGYKEDLKKKSRNSKRLIRSDLEFPGGFLDDKIISREGEKAITTDLINDCKLSEDTLMLSLDFENIRNSLDKEKDKEIFSLYYGPQDETMKEIANMIGISQQAVSKRLQKIKRHIEKITK